MSTRFDSIRYDSHSQELYDNLKCHVLSLEAAMDEIGNGRTKLFAMAALEECYLWIGKAIRDDQLRRMSADKESVNDYG